MNVAKNRFANIRGARSVDAAAVTDFMQIVKKDVIPEILKVVEERRVLAAQKRKQTLKT